MSAGKHTPGPWVTAGVVIVTDQPEPQTIGYSDDHRNTRATCIERKKANARLMAAAPDLAAALDALVALAYDSDYADDDPMTHDARVQATLAAAEAALVKAGVRS